MNPDQEPRGFLIEIRIDAIFSSLFIEVPLKELTMYGFR